MSERPWYKRYPTTFIAETYELDAVGKGVYAMLQALTGGGRYELRGKPSGLAKACGCSTYRFNMVCHNLKALGLIEINRGRLRCKVDGP